MKGIDGCSIQEEDAHKECNNMQHGGYDDSYSKHEWDDLVKLKFGFGGDSTVSVVSESVDISSGEKWEKCGKVIGGSKRLKELQFSGISDEVMSGDFQDVFIEVPSNRSICTLDFERCNLVNGEIFGMLRPFFKNNYNFESLKLNRCDLGHNGHRFLMIALSEFASLREFELSRCGTDHYGFCFQPLTNHSGLVKLSLRENRIDKNGCDALATLLQDPESELAELSLIDSELDDEKAVILASGLTKNSSLKKLALNKNPFISEIGWKAIFATLESSACVLENLFIQDNWVNDTAQRSLAASLVKNSSLKVLQSNCFYGNIITGSREIFEFLRSHTCELEELYLLDSGFNEYLAICLAKSLADNRSLKCLDLSGTYGITKAGWRALSSVLLSPHSELEILCLSSCGMDNEAVAPIQNALVKNCRLRELSLQNNSGITPKGWEAFSTVLRNPNSALEKLDIRNNSINNYAMISLANSLTENDKLRVLLMGTCGDFSVNAIGWATFSRVLCDLSSVSATYSSNHILEQLCADRFSVMLPEDISFALSANRECSKHQSARQKIIKAHFSGTDVNILPFVEMGLKVMPFVLSWMANDCAIDGINSDELALLFQFVQSVVPCFLPGGQAKTFFRSKAKRRRCK